MRRVQSPMFVFIYWDIEIGDCVRSKSMKPASASYVWIILQSDRNVSKITSFLNDNICVTVWQTGLSPRLQNFKMMILLYDRQKCYRMEPFLVNLKNGVNDKDFKLILEVMQFTGFFLILVVNEQNQDHITNEWIQHMFVFRDIQYQREINSCCHHTGITEILSCSLIQRHLTQ